MSTIDAAIINHIVNGGGGGGSTTDEITLVNQDFRSISHDPEHSAIQFVMVEPSVGITGAVMKIYNTTTSTLESYVLVRLKPDSELKPDTAPIETNGYAISLDDDRILDVCYQTYGQTNYNITVIVPIDIIYADPYLETEDPATAETGLYRMDKMSSATLTKIVTNLPQMSSGDGDPNEIKFKDPMNDGTIIKYHDSLSTTRPYISIGSNYNTSLQMEVYNSGKVNVNGDFNVKDSIEAVPSETIIKSDKFTVEGNMSAPNIYTKAQVDELLSSAAGGDTGTVVDGAYVQTSSANKLYVREIPSEADLSTGMLLNLWHIDSGTIHRFVLIRGRHAVGETSGTAKSDDNFLYPLTDGLQPLAVKIYIDGSKYMIEALGVEDGTYTTSNSETKYMKPVQLSGKTLATILQGQNEVFARVSDIIEYLEGMVEQLKQKAGL